MRFFLRWEKRSSLLLTSVAFRGFLVLAMFGVLTAVSSFVSPSASAHSAVSLVKCVHTQSTCDKQDPTSAGCAKASGLQRAYVDDANGNKIGQITIGFNSSCGTNFATFSPWGTPTSKWTMSATIHRNSGKDGGAEAYTTPTYSGSAGKSVEKDTLMVFFS